MERADPTTALPEILPMPEAVPDSIPLAEEVVPLALPVESLPICEVNATLPPIETPSTPPPETGRWIRTLHPPPLLRRAVEIVLIFGSTILFLRAIALEPFGVPTGSMSPTLIGNHKVFNCPRCGFTIRVGEPSRHLSDFPRVTCPNCGQHDIDANEGILVSGDRLLVDKNVYSLRKPRRWEPAVFRCPSDMTKPYVKRVAGLPNERILVRDGDIYVNGRIMRKRLDEVREARVLIHDMNFSPQPYGWSKTWVFEPAGPAKRDFDKVAEAPFNIGERELRLDGTHDDKKTLWLAYRHQRIDETTGESKDDVIRDSFVYNAASPEERPLSVYDFSTEFEVEVLGGSGSISVRLFDGKDHVIATCPVGSGSQDFTLRQDGMPALRSASRKALRAGKKYRIEAAFVDRRVSFAIDGSETFVAYDLDPQTRTDVISPLAIGVNGVNAVVRDLKIYRDIYYRSSSGRNAVNEELALGPDEYFMLGDNSANSDDSRSWPIPGVPERNFLGKPFLLHQPSRISRLKFNGRERVFPLIDWSRIRFLR